MTDDRLLVAHVVFSFHTGGLENGIVNLINHLPAERFRHVIISLTTCAPSMCERIRPADVDFIEMKKRPGHAIGLYPGLYRLFRSLRPLVVHTRNLAALEAMVPARLAGVPARIHGEHGWDVHDPHGTRLKYRVLRRAYAPFVTRYVALSRHLESYLVDRVGIAAHRVTRICNGVDTERFHPAICGRDPVVGGPLNESRLRVIGTVGRLHEVKDQLNLVRAFALLRERKGERARDLRLMLVGDGPLRERIASEVKLLGIGDVTWLAGERGDIPDVMRGIDIFVLPSRAEGISNTILEAMASGLPVVATAVGGNSELVVPGETGYLAPPGDSAALAQTLARYMDEPDLIAAHGRNARARAESEFSLNGMISEYAALYGAGADRVQSRIATVS